ncbi:MAG: DUF4389 domain-containing protein [Dehalococcoidia bacterium]
MTSQWTDPTRPGTPGTPDDTAASPPPGGGYPVRFSVDYPEGPRNRLTVFFRPVLVVPIYIVLAALQAAWGSSWWGLLLGPGLALVLMILFRGKYPRPWFDWWVYLQQFGARVGIYLTVLRDEYPATDSEQAVHLEFDYPEPGTLSRWLPLVKWLLLLPHYFVLILLSIGSAGANVAIWFAIMFTGRTPRGFFDIGVAVSQWAYRVMAYGFMLTTDEYPPFRLDLPPGSRGSIVLSIVIGIVFTAVIVLITAALIGVYVLLGPGRGFPTPVITPRGAGLA